MSLGGRLRKIRRVQGRPLRDVSRKAEITASLLSKIENDKSRPPVGTLTRIARALGVSMTSLLSDDEVGGTVFVSKKDSKHMIKTDKGYSFHNFASRRANKLMEVYLFSAKSGKVAPQAMSHRGEEFIYVLTGRMKYRVGNTNYTLGAGDGLYFDSIADHDLQPISDEVTYIAVFCDGRQT